MEVLLDTNFIISCLKKKIDFISQLEELGFKVLLPREVYQELKDIRERVPSGDRGLVDVALNIFNNKKVKKMTVGGRNVDDGLILKGKEGYYIATLDGAIKRIVPNTIIINTAGNRIMIVRK